MVWRRVKDVMTVDVATASDTTITPTELRLDVHGAAVGVVDGVDAKLFVELGAECWVASVQGLDQPADLLQESSHRH